MTKSVLCLLFLSLLLISTFAQDTSTLPWFAKGLSDEWAAFKLKFSKTYTTIQAEIKAFENWLLNRRSAHASSTATYTLGETSMSDLSKDEFKQKYLNLIVPKSAKNSVRGASDASKLAPGPDSIDWRGQSKVTPVKNQGQCGSCWAFATVGSLEALNLILGNSEELYSEQDLVDCSYNVPGSSCSACNGGWPSGAMKWLSQSGIVRDSDYPYKEDYTGQSQCPNLPRASLKIGGAGTVAQGNTDELSRAVAIQPVVVCIDASNWGQYTSGIFNDCQEDVNSADHAVLLVGYTEDAWIIKNSWGTGWGEEGYIRLARPGNTCGVANYANYPLRSGSSVTDHDSNCKWWKSYCHSNDYVIGMFFVFWGSF